MQTEIDYQYGDIKLTLLVDYDDDGVSLEEVHHNGEDISELIDRVRWTYLQAKVGQMHTKLLEADKITRAEHQIEKDFSTPPKRPL